MAQEISPLELQKLMASETPHAVLDVRPGERFRAGQIFRSTTVPLDELRDRMPALVPVRSVITVLLHDDEESSKGSVAKAEAMGYSEIRWLEGGYAGWTAAGLPVIDGWSVVGKDHGERLLVQEPVPEIEANALAKKIKNGERVVVLDSRTPAEFSRGCIPGGRSVPGGELPLEITDILAKEKDKDVTVVVNCAGRTRSILGAFQLGRMGIPNVVALRNGTMGWQLAGHQLQERTQAQRPPGYSAQAVEAAETAATEIACACRANTSSGTCPARSRSPAGNCPSATTRSWCAAHASSPSATAARGRSSPPRCGRRWDGRSPCWTAASVRGRRPGCRWRAGASSARSASASAPRSRWPTT